MAITSLQNPRIKAIRALSQRKRRQETGLFFAEGIRLAGEAVQTGADVETLVFAPELLRSDFGKDTVRRAREADVEILEVGADVFRSLSGKDGPAGIGVVARQRLTAMDDVGVGHDNTLGWVVLEDVGNPGNLGSILRTSDATGTTGVILLGNTADPYDPEAIRGSMGAIFSQQVIRSSLEALIQWKRQINIPMIGTSDAAQADYRSATYAPPLLLCLGGEQHGLSSEAVEACDTVVRIPMAGRADSLNLAVAAGVMLYEVLRRMRNMR
ncbi:MAG: RNA methyltransferase [Gemmatimonadetes bacterium]|nr:RNA methyltransferase [Gemmatimonadota bacterium]